MIYTKEHYNIFSQRRDMHLFTDIVEDIIKNEMSDSFRNLISDADLDKKRMAILMLYGEAQGDHDSRFRFEKLRGLNNMGVDRLEHIQEVLSMLRKYVKVADVEVKKFGEVMTPLERVKDVTSHLPKSVWSNPNLKWLDPANGTGPFPMWVVYRLMKGLEEWEPDAEKRYKHIVENMIYVCEIQPKNMFLFMCLLDPFKKYKLNVYTGSFLDAGFDEHRQNVWGVDRFSVILGNPPYQDATKSQVKLWPLFINKSVSLLEEGGLLQMMFPSVWINRPNGQKFKRTTEMFARLQLDKVITESADDKWFDIGESVCCVILENSPKHRETLFLEGGKSISVDYRAERVVFDEKAMSMQGIISKMNYVAREEGKYAWHEDLHHNSSKAEMIGDGRLKSERGEGDSVIWYTASQMFYTDSANVASGWRVMVNLSGYYFKVGQESKYMKIVEGEGCVSGMRSVMCRDREAADALYTVLSSKLYRFYNDYQKTSGFNTSVLNFPKIESKPWTDGEIYQRFGLTDEEISLVEDFISGK